MGETLPWQLGTVVAVLVLALGGALTVVHARARTRRARRGAGIDAVFICPLADELTRVRLGLDPAGRGATVLSCERFGGGAITCDRACFAGFLPVALRH